MPKEVRDAATTAENITVEKLPTPSLGLNRATHGGFAMGRFVLLYGPKSAGKTSFCLEQIARAQETGKSCLYVDVERTFESSWAERLGVDTPGLFYKRATSFEHVSNVVSEFLVAGVDVIVIDSISVIVPSSYMNEGETKRAEDTGRIGALAADMSKAMSRWIYNNEDTLVVMVSQTRAKKLSSTIWGTGPTGGNAPLFSASQVVRLTSGNGPTFIINDGVQVGDKIIKHPIGRKVNFELEYSKTSPQGTTGSYNFYFGTDDVGIDNIEEIARIAIEIGAVQQGGAWYRYGDGKWQGLPNFVNAIREDQVLQDKLRGEIDGR